MRREPSIIDKEKKFTGWQESIYRGLLGFYKEGSKQWPTQSTFSTKDFIYPTMAACCHALHNMCVPERVMDSCTAMYNLSVEANPELEIKDAATRLPPGVVNLPVEALAPPPPVGSLHKRF